MSIRLLALVLLFAPARAFADYATETVALSGSYNTVQIEAYDGQGPGEIVAAFGTPLGAGQVRLTFSHSDYPIQPPGFGEGTGHANTNNLSFQALQAVGFNTDLNFYGGLITSPPSWHVMPNFTLGNLGSFSWVLGAVENFEDNVSVLISGLGTDATLNHFTVGTPQFGANLIDISFNQSGLTLTSQSVSGSAEPQATPEPTSLALAGLGIGGLALRRYGRRKTPLAG